MYPFDEFRCCVTVIILIHNYQSLYSCKWYINTWSRRILQYLLQLKVKGSMKSPDLSQIIAEWTHTAYRFFPVPSYILQRKVIWVNYCAYRWVHTVVVTDLGLGVWRFSKKANETAATAAWTLQTHSSWRRHPKRLQVQPAPPSKTHFHWIRSNIALCSPCTNTHCHTCNFPFS